MLQIFLRVILLSLHMFTPLGRNGLDIFIPKVYTASAKKGTFYTGAQAFNNLPPHLKEVGSIMIFKTQLKMILYILEFWY